MGPPPRLGGTLQQYDAPEPGKVVPTSMNPVLLKPGSDGGHLLVAGAGLAGHDNAALVGENRELNAVPQIQFGEQS